MGAPAAVPPSRNNFPQGPLNAAERQELVELRRKLRQVRVERDILAKACAPGLPEKTSGRLQRPPARESKPGQLTRARPVRNAQGLHQRVLRLAESCAEQTGASQNESTQYASGAFGNRCKEMGVRPSTGTVGDAYDNAMAGSFFATLECELIAQRNWKTKTEARLAIFTWIESWYNPQRRHSGLNYLSPNNFERKHQENTVNPETQIIPEL